MKRGYDMKKIANFISLIATINLDNPIRNKKLYFDVDSKYMYLTTKTNEDEVIIKKYSFTKYFDKLALRDFLAHIDVADLTGALDRLQLSQKIKPEGSNIIYRNKVLNFSKYDLLKPTVR
jgi:hypothetical protein